MFIYSKHWFNVGMNHHVLVIEACKDLGKFKVMSFSKKKKSKKICYHNCFL